MPRRVRFPAHVRARHERGAPATAWNGVWGRRMGQWRPRSCRAARRPAGRRQPRAPGGRFGPPASPPAQSLALCSRIYTAGLDAPQQGSAALASHAGAAAFMRAAQLPCMMRASSAAALITRPPRGCSFVRSQALHQGRPPCRAASVAAGPFPLKVLPPAGEERLPVIAERRVSAGGAWQSSRRLRAPRAGQPTQKSARRGKQQHWFTLTAGHSQLTAAGDRQNLEAPAPAPSAPCTREAADGRDDGTAPGAALTGCVRRRRSSPAMAPKN